MPEYKGYRKGRLSEETLRRLQKEREVWLNQVERMDKWIRRFRENEDRK